VRSPWVAALVIAAGIVVYPVTVLAVDGPPAFPSAHDCVHPATSDGKIWLVLGRFSDMAPAEQLAIRAARAGFVGTIATLDGCGRVVVATPGYTTLSGAQSAVEEARAAGFTASPEFEP